MTGRLKIKRCIDAYLCFSALIQKNLADCRAAFGKDLVDLLGKNLVIDMTWASTVTVESAKITAQAHMHNETSTSLVSMFSI